MKKITSSLVAIVLASVIGKTALASENAADICVSEEKMRYVAENIPKMFKEIMPDTYLVETVLEAKNGYDDGGQLIAYMPFKEKNSSLSMDPSSMSFYDLRNINPGQWYSVNNWNTNMIGCAGKGVFYFNNLNSANSNPQDAQVKFNSIIADVYNAVKKEMVK